MGSGIGKSIVELFAAAIGRNNTEIREIGESIAKSVKRKDFDTLHTAIQTVREKDWSSEEKTRAISGIEFNLGNRRVTAFTAVCGQNDVHAEFTGDERIHLISAMIHAGIDPFSLCRISSRPSSQPGHLFGLIKKQRTFMHESYLHDLAKKFGTPDNALFSSFENRVIEPLEVILTELAARDGADSISKTLRDYKLTVLNGDTNPGFPHLRPKVTIESMVPIDSTDGRKNFKEMLRKIGINLSEDAQEPKHPTPPQPA